LVHFTLQEREQEKFLNRDKNLRIMSVNSILNVHSIVIPSEIRHFRKRAGNWFETCRETPLHGLDGMASITRSNQPPRLHAWHAGGSASTSSEP